MPAWEKCIDDSACPRRDMRGQMALTKPRLRNVNFLNLATLLTGFILLSTLARMTSLRARQSVSP